MAKQNTTSGWDPVLIVSQVSLLARLGCNVLMTVQIISLQTLHYLTLAILVSPMLSIFAERNSLEYEGGAANVGTLIYVSSD